jgi:hypothetical protein
MLLAEINENEGEETRQKYKIIESYINKENTIARKRYVSPFQSKLNSQ